MNVAKPPGGFNIVVRPAVQAMADDIIANHPEFPRHWQAVLARLKEAGHLAGGPVDGNASQRAGVFQPFYSGPNITLAWSVLGDTVTVIQGYF
jgi:hypothetical protein